MDLSCTVSEMSEILDKNVGLPRPLRTLSSEFHIDSSNEKKTKKTGLPSGEKTQKSCIYVQPFSTGYHTVRDVRKD